VIMEPAAGVLPALPVLCNPGILIDVKLYVLSSAKQLEKQPSRDSQVNVDDKRGEGHLPQTSGSHVLIHRPAHHHHHQYRAPPPLVPIRPHESAATPLALCSALSNIPTRLILCGMDITTRTPSPPPVSPLTPESSRKTSAQADGVLLGTPSCIEQGYSGMRRSRGETVTANNHYRTDYQLIRYPWRYLGRGRSISRSP
jgi:hypothetical protein